jgi:hypothetical protein
MRTSINKTAQLHANRKTNGDELRSATPGRRSLTAANTNHRQRPSAMPMLMKI